MRILKNSQQKKSADIVGGWDIGARLLLTTTPLSSVFFYRFKKEYICYIIKIKDIKILEE